MDYKKLIAAIKLCGSTPKVDECKACAYWAGGDMSKCIPRMTMEAAAAITDLLVENQSMRNAADVSPVRHGRWEQTGYACGETEFQCSECKQTEWRTSISRFNFCPFCGAKMDAEG